MRSFQGFTPLAFLHAFLRVLAPLLKAPGLCARSLLVWLLLSCAAHCLAHTQSLTLNQANAAYHQGVRLAEQQTSTGYIAAIHVLEQAASAYHKLGRRKDEGSSFGWLGQVYYSMGQPQQARHYYQYSLALHRQAKNTPGAAICLYNIGNLYVESGEMFRALQSYRESLSLFQSLGRQKEVASAFHQIGKAYESLGSMDMALKSCRTALILYQRLGRKSDQANVNFTIGVIYQEHKAWQAAHLTYGKAIALYQQVHDTASVGAALNNTALLYFQGDQPHRALAAYRQALSIFQQLGREQDLANTLTCLAAVYDQIGPPEKALEYHVQSLALYRRLGKKREAAAAQAEIGLVRYYFLQVLLLQPLISRSTSQAVPTNPGGPASVPAPSVGTVPSASGAPTLESLQQPGAPATKNGDKEFQAEALTRIINYHVSMRQFQAAMPYCFQALALWRELGNRFSPGDRPSNWECSTGDYSK